MGDTGGRAVQKTIQILERQRQDLVVRVLKKHEEMESSRLFTERILAGISEFFLLLDSAFRVMQANREFLERTGYPPLDERPLFLDDLVEDDQAGEIRRHLDQGEFREFQAKLRTRDGKWLPVKMRGSTHVNPDGLIVRMLICSDCSESYDLMAQMREGQKQLLHSSRLASLGEMAAGIGHELTQPLNAILLFARNGLKALDAPGDHRELLRENLQVIIDRVNKASSIIATMRSFGRKVEEEQAPVELNAIIRKILHFLESQLRLSEIELDLKLSDAPCVVLGVDVLMEEVVINVL
jgi:C4-dicarboxylate-specific signal transduction histidine kinase